MSFAAGDGLPGRCNGACALHAPLRAAAPGRGLLRPGSRRGVQFRGPRPMTGRQRPLPATPTDPVIRLHRLGHPDEDYQLNPDLIVSIEAKPDSVVTLTTGAKVLVAECPETIVAAIAEWRASVLEAALPRRSGSSRAAGLTLVRGTAGAAAGPNPAGEVR
jgi:flagellar protein FlbD